jgi:hypothetical protein
MAVLDNAAKPAKQQAPAPARDVSPIPGASDALGRYHYMLTVAPIEAIEQAATAALSKLEPAARLSLYDRLTTAPSEVGKTQHAATRTGDASQLARLALQSEQRRAGAFEAALRSLELGGAGAFSTFVYNFLGSPAGAAFFASIAASASEREQDPDFSQEFGNDEGFAGGSGFEHDAFDKWT